MMKKRLFNVFLALALCLALLPMAALADEPTTYDLWQVTTGEGESATSNIYYGNYDEANPTNGQALELEDYNYKTFPAGSYQLASNITLESKFLINNTVTLDLNGKTLTGKPNTIAIDIRSGSLTIKDSGTNGKVVGCGHWAVCATDGSFTLESGTLGYTGTNPSALSVSDGTATLKGGTVDGDCNNDDTLYADGGIVTGAIRNEGVITRSATATDTTVFRGTVTANRTIAAGIFYGNVTNQYGPLLYGGTISGGTFYGTVTNKSDSTVSGTVTNNGMFIFEPGYSLPDNAAAFGLSGTGCIQADFDMDTKLTDLDYYSNDGTTITDPATKKVVTFDLNGGTGTIPPQGVYDSGKAIKPADPTAPTGYIFGGWYEKENGAFKESAFDFNTVITGDLTLTAKWLSIPVSLTDATVTVDEFTYNGTAQVPAAENVTVTISGTVIPSEYYTISATAQTKPGTYDLTITGDGTTCTGGKTETWIIKKGTLNLPEKLYLWCRSKDTIIFDLTQILGELPDPTCDIQERYKEALDETPHLSAAIEGNILTMNVDYEEGAEMHFKFDVEVENYETSTIEVLLRMVNPSVRSSCSLDVTMEDWTYGETAKEPQYTIPTDGLYWNLTHTYYQEGEDTPLSSKPTDPGKYKVVVSYEFAKEYDRGYYWFIYTGETTFEIKQATSSFEFDISGEQLALTYGTPYTFTPMEGSVYGKLEYTVTSGADAISVDKDTGVVTPKQEGTAYITVRETSPNYTAYSIDVMVLVNKRPATLTVKDKTAQVGDAAPDLSSPVAGTDYTVSGLLDGDALSVTLSYGSTPDMTKPSQYQIIPTCTDARYDVVATPGSLSVVALITFDPNGGTVDLTSATTDVDGKLTELPTPTRSGSYRFDGWFTKKIGGMAVTVNTVFTANTTVYAHWTYTGNTTPDYCVIKATAGEGGSITPFGRSAVLYGGNKTFTITPDDGYAIADVKIDGRSIGAATSYTFTNVKKDHTIMAIFMEAPDNPQTGMDIPFTDVTENNWFYEDVVYVYANGLMNGTDETTFSPNLTTTRGMIVTILYRLEEEPSVSGSCPFNDVASGSYYENAIIWAEENGIVNGYDNNCFGPDDPITREQMAVILYRYAQHKKLDVSVGEDTNILSYNDALDISAYAFPAMQWVCGEGIMQGNNGNLMPQDNTTRAQVAAILHRFCKNVLK